VSGATFFRDEARPLSPLWRFIFIVVVFLLVWPPICGIVGWWMKFDPGPPYLGWVAFIVIYSYFVCAPAALLAGIIHAVAAIRFHHNSMWVPLLAAAGAAIVTMALILAIAPGPAYDLIDLINVPLESYALFLIPSLVASLICWRLTRRFARTA
jgi:hypothetical protein